jgi:hypothetical protein
MHYACLENYGWGYAHDMALYDMNVGWTQKTATSIELTSTDPKLGADMCLQPFYRFIGHVFWNSNDDNHGNFYSIANSALNLNFDGNAVTTWNVNGLGFIFAPWTKAAHSLNANGSWTKLDQYSSNPDCHLPYDFTTYGRLLFGVESTDWSCFLFCENCIIYSPDSRSTTSAIKAYWKNDHSGIQISWYQFYEDEVFLISVSNICYRYSIANPLNYVTTLSPPQYKTFNQIWGEGLNIYYNTTDDGVYQLGEDGVWVPIFNVMAKRIRYR